MREITGAVRKCQVNNLRTVPETTDTDTTIHQRSLCHFKQAHHSVRIPTFNAIMAQTGIKPLTNTVARNVSVTSVNMRIRTFVGWRCTAPHFSKKQVFCLFRRAFNILKALHFQRIMFAAKHGEQVFNPVDAVLLRYGTGGGAFRVGDHPFKCIWHMFKILNSF